MTNEKIEELLAEISRLTANKIQEVEEIRVKLLGKKGDITKLFEEFRNVLPEQKREFGKKLNILKTKAAEKIEELRAKVATSAKAPVGWRLWDAEWWTLMFLRHRE